MKIAFQNLCNKELALLFILYCLGQSGILMISGARFWDDWPFFVGDLGFIFKYSKEMGHVFGFSQIMLASVNGFGVYFHKALVFILFFLTAFFLNDILKKYDRHLDKNTRYLILLFFLLFPFNMARILLATYTYSLSYFLFFFAWYLLRKNKVFSFILFFVSFSLNSLLVFFLIPILDIFYSEGGFSSLRNFLFCIRKYIFFLLLPISYFFIKTYFYKPFGAYEGYNTNFSFNTLFDSIPPFINNLLHVPMRGKSTETYTLALIISPIVIFILNKFKFNLIHKKNNINRILIFLGLFFSFLASFPYLILGHIHNFETWNSRHQILMPLGFSLFLTGLLNSPWIFFSNYMREQQVKFALMVFIISTSIAFQMHFFFKAYIDFRKQEYQIQLLSKNNDIKNANLVIFYDETTNYEYLENLYKRQLETYEWNSIMLKAFKDNNESRYGISSSRAYYFQNYFVKAPNYSALALERASKHIYDKTNFTLVSFKAYPNQNHFDCLYHGMSSCIYMNVNKYFLKYNKD